MNRKPMSAVPLLLLCMLGAGCADQLLTPTPALSITEDSFGFAVSGQNMSLDETYELTFTGDSLRVSIAVIAYRQGTAQFEMLGENGTVLFSRDISRDVAENIDLTVASRPKEARVHFDGYTASISLSVIRAG